VHHLRVRRLLLLLPLASMLAGCALPHLPATAEPIETYWRDPGDGVIQFKPTEGGFEGVVVQPRTGGSCPEPKGTVFIKAKGSGSHYTGQTLWWHTPGCVFKFSDKMTLDLKDGNKTAHMCSPNPFGGDPPTECLDMKRVDNFKPSASPGRSPTKSPSR
jgi:hypothetical protein